MNWFSLRPNLSPLPWEKWYHAKSLGYKARFGKIRPQRTHGRDILLRCRKVGTVLTSLISNGEYTPKRYRVKSYIAGGVNNLSTALIWPLRYSMILSQYMDVLLVRFEKSERAFIRRWARKSKVSEAAVVRSAVNNLRAEFAAKTEHQITPHTMSSDWRVWKEAT